MKNAECHSYVVEFSTEKFDYCSIRSNLQVLIVRLAHSRIRFSFLYFREFQYGAHSRLFSFNREVEKIILRRQTRAAKRTNFVHLKRIKGEIRLIPRYIQFRNTLDIGDLRTFTRFDKKVLEFTYTFLYSHPVNLSDFFHCS